MTHDPLCWYADPDKIPAAAANDGWPCLCDLIAKVRADERRACVAEVEAFHDESIGFDEYQEAAWGIAQRLRQP